MIPTNTSRPGGHILHGSSPPYDSTNLRFWTASPGPVDPRNGRFQGWLRGVWLDRQSELAVPWVSEDRFWGPDLRGPAGPVRRDRCNSGFRGRSGARPGSRQSEVCAGSLRMTFGLPALGSCLHYLQIPLTLAVSGRGGLEQTSKGQGHFKHSAKSLYFEGLFHLFNSLKCRTVLFFFFFFFFFVLNSPSEPPQAPLPHP